MCRSIRWTALVAVAAVAAGCSENGPTAPAVWPTDGVTIVTVCDLHNITEDCIPLWQAR